MRIGLGDGARRYHRQAARQNELEELSVTFAGPNMEAESYGNPEGLKRAIECLPPHQRTDIQLLKLREMSLQEAAEASGSSIDALKVSVHRAMATDRVKDRHQHHHGWVTSFLRHSSE